MYEFCLKVGPLPSQAMSPGKVLKKLYVYHYQLAVVDRSL